MPLNRKHYGTKTEQRVHNCRGVHIHETVRRVRKNRKGVVSGLWQPSFDPSLVVEVVSDATLTHWVEKVNQ